MCDFCKFDRTYEADKSLMLERYKHLDAIGAMGAKVQKDFDGVPMIAVWVSTPKCGYQNGFDIKYCPKCGRKLV